MKFLAFLFPLMLQAVVPVELAHTLTQATDLTTAITTAPIDTRGASILIVVWANTSNVDAAGVSISDSQGNTWIKLTSQALATSVSVIICYSYLHSAAPLVTSSTHTITASLAGSSARAVVFSAWSGTLTTGDPFDGVQTGAKSLAVASLATGNITPAGDGRLVVSGVSDRACITNTSSPITEIAVADWLSASPVFKTGIGYAATVQTTAAAIGTTWTMNGGTCPGTPGDMAVTIAAFKPALTFTGRRHRVTNQ